MTHALLSFLIFSLANLVIESAKILAVFPAPSISHQVVFRPIIQELARRGHEVTVVTPDPVFSKGSVPVNLTEIDLHEVSYALQDQIFSISDNNNFASHVDAISYLFLKIFETQIETDAMQNLIKDKNKQYDLLLLESCYRTTLGLSHVFKSPVIQISSFGTLEANNYAMGSSIHPIYYPTPLYHRKIYKHSFWEKIQAIYKQYVHQKIVDSYEILENAMLKKHFGPDIPTIRELSNNVDMLFLNVHPIWENNRPVPPNVVYLGGLPQKSNMELPKDLQSYLDSSKGGVIYISFGTNVNPSRLPVEKVQIFMRVFSQLPYEVLWKWDQNDLPGKPDNVRIRKWFPQSDLLKHPKIKLFITQGGLQSIDETIIAGVPIIGIPMLIDQWFNVEKCVHNNIGIKLELEDVEEDSLMKAINTVIEDQNYRKNITQLRTIMYDQPETALERAIYWTEYVIRHGGARQLRAPTANISWTQYYELEVVGVLLLIFVGTITAVSGICFVMMRLILKKNVKAKRS